MNGVALFFLVKSRPHLDVALVVLFACVSFRPVTRRASSSLAPSLALPHTIFHLCTK